MDGIKSKVEMGNEIREKQLSTEQTQFLKKIHLWLLKNKDVVSALPYFDGGNITVEEVAYEVSIILTLEFYYPHHIFFLNNLRHLYIRERYNKLFDYDV